MRRRQALASLLAAGWAGGSLPAAAAGTAAHEDLDWRDRSRSRDVPVRLYWPEAALGEVPLVLFSHGFGGERSHASWLGRTLAAQGIACAHVQHIGSDYRVWLSGPLDWAVRQLRGEMSQERLDRVLDLQFTLDRLLQGERGARIDRHRIAAAGHSLGAQTALLLGGAQLPRERQPLRDARVGAVVAIGTAAFPGIDTAALLRGVQAPSLHISTEEDKTSMPGYAAGIDDRVAWYRATGGPAKSLAVFSHGRHALLNDAGPEDPVAASAAALVLAFLRSLWQGDTRALAAWRERQGTLVSRFESQGDLHRIPSGVRT
jgi:dienelactone hydrolase